MTNKKRSDSKPPRHRDLDLWVLSLLRSTDTGVRGAVIWVAAGEFDIERRDLGPRLLVVLGDSIRPEGLAGAVSVALESPADVIGALPPGVASQVLAFVTKNREVLLRHWRGDLDSREMLALLTL